MPRAVRVKIDRSNVRRLLEGKEVTINLPPDASELRLTIDTTDEDRRKLADMFSRVGEKSYSDYDFSDIFPDLFKGRK